MHRLVSRATRIDLPSLVDSLAARGTVLLDGAWGTELAARGLASGALADLWNLSHPQLVESVARAYIDAGSQVILSNTFRANRFALTRSRAQVREVNRAGIAISRRAAEGRAHVFASVGPSGRSLATGEVGEHALREAFREQCSALAEAGAEAVAIETMQDPYEAAIAVAAVRETGLPAIACMLFESGPQSDRTCTGVSIEAAVRIVVDAGADAVGTNCCRRIEGAAALCARMRATTDRPIWVKASAGLPALDGTRLVYPTSAARFAGEIPALIHAGAGFVGGCCGTTPAFIATIRSALRGRF